MNKNRARRYAVILTITTLALSLCALNIFRTECTIGTSRLETGKTTRINVYFLGYRIPYQLISYKSSFPSAARVSRDGTVKATDYDGSGSTTVMVRCGLSHHLMPVLVDPDRGTPLPSMRGKIELQVWRRIPVYDDTIFEVAIENSSHLFFRKEKIEVNPKHFKLVTFDGYSFAAELSPDESLRKDMVKVIKLDPGQWTGGYIVFSGTGHIGKGRVIYDDGIHPAIPVSFDHRQDKMEMDMEENIDPEDEDMGPEEAIIDKASDYEYALCLFYDFYDLAEAGKVYEEDYEPQIIEFLDEMKATSDEIERLIDEVPSGQTKRTALEWLKGAKVANEGVRGILFASRSNNYAIYENGYDLVVWGDNIMWDSELTGSHAVSM